MNDTFEQEITDLLIKYRGIQSSIIQTNNSIKDIENQLSILESERDTLKLCKPIIDDIINIDSQLRYSRCDRCHHIRNILINQGNTIRCI